MNNSTRISSSGVHQRGGYAPRGGSNATTPSTSFRPQRPANTTRPSFQVSHTPAPALTTLVGGGTDNSSGSNRSHHHTNRVPSTNVRPSTSTYNYSNQERNQPPPTRPPMVGYTAAPRHQTTSYQHQPMATQQTVAAPPPVTHQMPPPTHYQQSHSIPGSITYPTHTQQAPVQTYAYQPRHQTAPATSSYMHTPAPSTSYAPPTQRTNYPSTAVHASQYQNPATTPTLSAVQVPSHATSVPVAAAPRSAKAMITN